MKIKIKRTALLVLSYILITTLIDISLQTPTKTNDDNDGADLYYCEVETEDCYRCDITQKKCIFCALGNGYEENDDGICVKRSRGSSVLMITLIAVISTVTLPILIVLYVVCYIGKKAEKEKFEKKEKIQREKEDSKQLESL